MEGSDMCSPFGFFLFVSSLTFHHIFFIVVETYVDALVYVVVVGGVWALVRVVASIGFVLTAGRAGRMRL